jgi:hypothetical protein
MAKKTDINRLIRRVQQRPDGKSFVRVRTLMSAFGASRRSPDLIRTIKQQLAAHGIRVEWTVSSPQSLDDRVALVRITNPNFEQAPILAPATSPPPTAPVTAAAAADAATPTRQVAAAYDGGISSDEWGHTAQLSGTIAVLDLWLWTEEKAVGEKAEKYLKSTEKKIAESSEYIASKNAQYFQNDLSYAVEFQTAFRSSRERSEILEAGTQVTFPQLDLLQLVKAGNVFKWYENLESLLIVAYLRHVFSNRKQRSQGQAIGSGQNALPATESSSGHHSYDLVITGVSPHGLSSAITNAAKGLKTLVIDDASEAMVEKLWRVREQQGLPSDFPRFAWQS